MKQIYMGKDENIKVDCKEITPEGKLICNIYTEDATEMLRRDIKPSHTELNVKDKVLDSSQSTEENKSIDETQSTDGTQSTKADSSNKQGCGCSKTTESSKIANFVAKFRLNEEN